MCEQSLPDIPLSSGWDRDVTSAILHVISLAYYAIAAARGWAANSINARVRLPYVHLAKIAPCAFNSPWSSLTFSFRGSTPRE